MLKFTFLRIYRAFYGVTFALNVRVCIVKLELVLSLGDLVGVLEIDAVADTGLVHDIYFYLCNLSLSNIHVCRLLSQSEHNSYFFLIPALYILNLSSHVFKAALGVCLVLDGNSFGIETLVKLSFILFALHVHILVVFLLVPRFTLLIISTFKNRSQIRPILKLIIASLHSIKF